MEYHFERVGNVGKISIQGRLVAANAEEFKSTVLEWLNENKELLFDLSGMDHIDSSGLGALVSLLQKAVSMGGTVKLACLQPKPRIVFDISKVYRVFEIFDDVDKALKSFHS